MIEGASGLSVCALLSACEQRRENHQGRGAFILTLDDFSLLCFAISLIGQEKIVGMAAFYIHVKKPITAF